MVESGLRYQWRLSESASPHDEPCQSLAQRLAVHPLVAMLLVHRGVTEVDPARSFLKPSLTDLHDPAAMPGIEDAATRIVQAVRQNQPIVIYGDYDVDGISASAILWHILKLAGAQVQCYVPHRIEEGYGLNSAAITELAKQQPLIVTVDCGITAIEPAKVARQAGVELIITDHHEIPSGDLPDAAAIVHPRLPGSAYPFGDLCGAGVAFKLAWQFAKVISASERVPDAYRDLLVDLLSLAALGTVADVVPLVDENRIITTFGLGQIKRTRFTGLNALIDATRLRQEKVDAFHVGFVLGPRLNACGRMGHADKALHLLTDVDTAEATDLAAFLTRENERRRATEREIFIEAQQMVHDGGYDRDDCPAIVLCKSGWHAGVLGIVASRLVDDLARPVVLLNIANGEAHGSARSVPGVPLHQAIESCAPLLNSFGGHAMAAGLRLDAERVESFRIQFTQYVNTLLQPADMVHVLDIDACCALGEMTLEMIDQLLRLAPFGRGNASPLFCLRCVRLDSAPQRVGREGLHLRLALRQQGRVVYAIGFGLGELADELAVGMDLDVVFEPKVSTWQGQRRAEYHMKDLKRAGSASSLRSETALAHDKRNAPTTTSLSEAKRRINGRGRNGAGC